MKDEDKSKEQLITELKALRQSVAESKEDKTDLKRAKDALPESEVKFKSFAKHALAGIYLIQDGVFKYVNPKFAQMFGYTVEECLNNMPFKNLVHAEDLAKVEEQINRRTSGEVQFIRHTFRGLKKNGQSFQAEVYASTGNHKGRPAATGTILDITERKQTEESLQRAKEDWERTFDAVPDLIAVLNKHYRIVRVNKAMAARLGVIPAECIGLKCYEAVHGTSEPPLYCPHRQLIKDGLEHTAELYEERLGGYFAVSVSPLFGPGGELIGSVHVCHDITERKLAEDALLESEARYRILAENATDVIWTVDMDMQLTYISPSVTRLLGFTAEEATARTMQQAYSPASFEKAIKVFAEEMALESAGHGDPNRSRILELELVHKDGNTVLVEGNFSFLRDPAGKAVGILSMARNITERKRTEEALQQSEREKAILNQIANVFLTIPDEKIFEEVLAVILKTLKCRYGVFGYTEDSGDLIIPSMTKEIWSDCQVEGKSMVFPPHLRGDSLWGKAIKEKKSFSSDEPFQTPEGHLPVYNFLTVPIIFANKTIGLVCVANKDGGFSVEDRAVLERIADNISPILNTRLQRDKQELERKRAEEALRENEAKLRQIIDLVPHMIFLKDWDGQYLLVNKAVAEAYKTSVSALMGKHHADFHPDESELQNMLQDDREVITKGETKFISEEPYTDAQGKVRFLQTTKVPFHLLGDKTPAVLGVAIDITDKKRAEEELRKSRDELELRVRERTAELEKANQELWQIPSKLIAILEEERKRLASDLHDSIGQTLAAVKFWVEMALKLKDAGDSSAALNQLEQFVPILQRSIEETRSIYMGLRPTMLDSHGLLATLEWLRQECMKLYPERHIELDTGITEGEIPENLKVNIFRIAQEALNNIAKHSKAEWVDISLSKNLGGIELVVSDDGEGMDLDIIMQTHTATSLGLTSMRERAELTGGRFSIESTPGEGTTVRACWPIEVQNQLEKGRITQRP
jgi:PAS domain S-box-containing protein